MNMIPSHRLVGALALCATLGLAGCVTQPAYGPAYSGSNYGYQQAYAPRPCERCGVVQSVQQVYMQSGNDSGLGTILGAIAGGVLGSTIGKGDGRTAATVIGAVAGGAVGNQVGQRYGDANVAWRIVVAMDNGQQAVVTQRGNPGVRAGDYVVIRKDRVYLR